MKVKEESENSGLRFSIKKAKITPFYGKQKGKRWKQGQISSLALKSLWMVTSAVKSKDACFLERKLLTNLDRVLKSKDNILPSKGHRVKTTVFPVAMYGCESWTIKKAEC